MVTQPYEYIKNHWILHVKMNYMASELQTFLQYIVKKKQQLLNDVSKVLTDELQAAVTWQGIKK